MGKVALLCFGLTFLAWSRPWIAGPGGDAGFAFDDREAILENPAVNGALPPVAAFGRDYWHHLGDAGHYRPTATLSLALDHRLFGARARGYHLTSALLHAAAALVLLLLLRRLGASPADALAAGLVFGLHPALADVAAWISGRTSSLSVLAGGAALLVLARGGSGAAGVGRTLLGAALLFLALGAKEDALVFLPAAPLVAALAQDGRRRTAVRGALLAAALALGTYLTLRAAALGSPLPHAPHAPLAELSLGRRLAFGGRALLEALGLLVAPVAHPPSYRRAPGFHPGAPPGPLAWLGLALPVVLVLVGSRGWHRAATPWARARSAGLLLAVLAWLPFLGLIPAGEVFAPRFLYLPLFLGAAALAPLLVRAPRPLALVLAALAVIGAWSRSGVYTGLVPWARAVLAEVPGDVAAWNTLGLGLEAEHRPEEARAAWRRACELDPGYGRAWSNLGRVQLAAGERDQARRSLARAAAAAPRSAVAQANLASLLLAEGAWDEAIARYRRATRLVPGLQPAWRGLARALAAAGREAEALEAVRRAVALDPKDARARQLLSRLSASAVSPP